MRLFGVRTSFIEKNTYRFSDKNYEIITRLRVSREPEKEKFAGKK